MLQAIAKVSAGIGKARKKSKEKLTKPSELGPRAKRLLRPADEGLEQDRVPLTASESASGLSSTNRAKASKSLQFSSTKDISTTCVSSTNSKQPLPASVRPLAYFVKRDRVQKC